jgi:transmembrane 9 superfamily protein 2/4
VLPIYLFAVFSLVDIIEWFEKSSAYQPFTSVIGLTLLWLIITAPIAYSGAYFGFVGEKDTTPCKVNSVRRQIPVQPWY